ncbi:MAG: alpha-ketoglutarate-dependent dioxygenase AlkB [Opitutales bacterium]
MSSENPRQQTLSFGFADEPVPRDVLPFDGPTTYYGRILKASDADRYLAELEVQIPWAPDEVRIAGKLHVTRRKTAWFGDAAYGYGYSGTTRTAQPWTQLLRELRERISARVGYAFNSCLLNRYADGGDGMSWHSDDEKWMAPGVPIASLSFGADRRFRFQHKHSGATAEVVLEHGSLLVMAGRTQQAWKHMLPKSKKVHDARINLTFRRFDETLLPRPQGTARTVV